MLCMVCFLKSNMDRFIGYKMKMRYLEKNILKSNMDRFIVFVVGLILNQTFF